MKDWTKGFGGQGNKRAFPLTPREGDSRFRRSVGLPSSGLIWSICEGRGRSRRQQLSGLLCPLGRDQDLDPMEGGRDQRMNSFVAKPGRDSFLLQSGLHHLALDQVPRLIDQYPIRR